MPGGGGGGGGANGQQWKLLCIKLFFFIKAITIGKCRKSTVQQKAGWQIYFGVIQNVFQNVAQTLQKVKLNVAWDSAES